MKLKFTEEFINKLQTQLDYIAKDKPSAARKFKTDLLVKIRAIPDMPYKHLQSIFFDKNDVRGLVFKGYVIVFKVDKVAKEIQIFGYVKYESNPFEAG